MVPVRVNAPDPVLTNAPEPEMTPEKVESAAVPVVRVFALSKTLPPVAPTPDRVPMVSLAATSKVAPEATATELASAIALPPETVSVPMLIVVAPL